MGAAAWILYLLAVSAFLEGSARAVVALGAPRLLVRGEDNATWRLRWLARRKEGRAGFPFDVHHPTRGWALGASVRDEAVFGGKILNTNAQGFRGADPPERRGRTRIVVFGDSFTFGEDVSDDETYPYFLGRALPCEVLNLGVQGYAHDQMLLYLEEQEGLLEAGDLVVLGFVAQDMERNLLEFRDFAKPRFDLENSRLVLRNTPVPTPEEVEKREAYRFRLLDLLEMTYQAGRWKVGVNGEEMKRLTRAILGEFVGEVRRRGARPVLAYLPVGREIGGQASEGPFFAQECQEVPAPCVDLTGAFAEEVAQGIGLKTEGHWDRREHHIAARVLAAALSRMLRPEVAVAPGPRPERHAERVRAPKRPV